MKIFRNYYKLINDFYNGSSNVIKLSILISTFITSLLIKVMLFENVGGIFGYALGLLSYLVLFPLFSFLFYKLN
ncbi:hypothetical protein A5881_001282 [Enterococcus termitis]|nr:hypothetical protein A5881_002985 [Enterococcus termitis]